MWRVVLPLLLVFSFVHGQKQWDQCSAQMRQDATLGVTCSQTNINHVVAPASVAPGYPLPGPKGCTWLISNVFGITFRSFRILNPGSLKIWDAFAPSPNPANGPTYTRSGTIVPQNISSNSGYFYMEYTPGSPTDSWEICAVAKCNATLCDACANGPNLAFAPSGTQLGNCPTGSAPSGTTCNPVCPSQQTGSLLYVCDDGVWNGPDGDCYASCTQDPITANGLTSYTLGTCASSGGIHGYTCFLQCNAGGYASTTCSNGYWSSPQSCGRDCTTAPTFPVAFTGTCSGTYHHTQQCYVTCAGNYTALNQPGFTCFDGSWFLNSGECLAPCTSLHPSAVGKFTWAYADGGSGNLSAFDGDISTSWQSPFDGDSLELDSCGAQVIDTVHFFVPAGANLTHFLDGEFWGSDVSTNVQFMVIKQLPSYGWNTLSVASTLSGPYSTVIFTANSTFRPVIAELEYLRTTPSIQMGTCGTPTLSGGDCTLVCAVGTYLTGDLSTTCYDGQWQDVCGSCNAYEWETGNWSTCSGGICGSVERPWQGVGTQTRTPTCVRKTDRLAVNDYYCSGTTRPDDSQVCNRTCPAIPRIISVTPYDGAVEITFNYTYWVDPTNVTIIDYVRSVIFTSDPEHIINGAPTNVAITSGGQSIWLFPGLNNGQRYTFTAYAYTAAGSQSLPSQESPSAVPQEPLGCYYNCMNNAPCVEGLCHCLPGYYTFNNTLIQKGAPRCDIGPSLSIDAFPTGTVFAVGGSVDITYHVNVSTGDEVKLYVYPASCTTKFCTRLYVNYNIPQGFNNTYTVNLASIYPGLETDQMYFFRLWLSPKTYADSTSFTPTDPACAGITCLNGGVCYNGFCQCTPAYLGSDFCETQRSPCDVAGLQCSAWGKCNSATAACDCDFGYAGDLCQYPPGCTLRCRNNGTLWEDPYSASGVGCERCDCVGLWTGTDCSVCGIDCQNGGSPDSTCKTCTCPSWWAGEFCQYPYVTATFYLNLDLKANGIDFKTDPVKEAYVAQFISEDIQWALNPPTYLYINVHDIEPAGSRTKVTVRFVNRVNPNVSPYAGDERLAQREALRMQIMDGASLFRITVTGQYVDPDSYDTQDPPATKAGALSIVPSIFTLCLALLATIVGRA